jgi:hypothetical protein
MLCGFLCRLAAWRENSLSPAKPPDNKQSIFETACYKLWFHSRNPPQSAAEMGYRLTKSLLQKPRKSNFAAFQENVNREKEDDNVYDF